MSVKNICFEVMQTLEKNIDAFLDKFLIAPEKIWQSSDFLPNPQGDNFIEEVKEIREISKDLPDDFWVTLVGDMITEEALPTYESWLLDLFYIFTFTEKKSVSFIPMRKKNICIKFRIY
jgi:acyl-[acyl-carrier-protein] desaturase